MENGKFYYLELQQTIISIDSATNWTRSKLNQLSIRFKHIDIQDPKGIETLLSSFNLESKLLDSAIEEALSLETPLIRLDSDLVSKFRSDKLQDEVLETLDPLLKSILAVNKHYQVEKYVYLMVTFLLKHCKFYENITLFAFPKFPFKLYFGEATADATADFTIMELMKSKHRIAVLEHKPVYGIYNEDEYSIGAQLLGLAIAMAQTNRLEQPQINEEQTILGIEIRDTTLGFYVIPITRQILEGMQTCSSVKRKTEIRCITRLASDRMKILQLLCIFRRIAEMQ